MSEIDYQAIAEQLQKECEQLRISLFQARHSQRHFKDMVNLEATWEFLGNNYLAIAAIAIIFMIVSSLIKTVMGLITTQRSKNSA